MDQDGTPGLAVGFRIEFGGSIEELMRMQKFMQSSEFQAVASANRIEGAFGKLNIAPASAKMSSFAGETSAATREAIRLEKQSEALVRQMTRQAEVFGKTASEIRQMNAAAKASRLDELGHTELAGRLRAASSEMDRLEASTGRVGARAKLSRNDMVNLGYQVNDVVVSLISGQKPMTVFVQQGAQIGQIAAGAGVGIRGMAASVAALAAPFLPVIALLGVATAGFGLFVREMNKGVTNEQLTGDLGKITGGANATAQELYKLRDETITWGDTTSALFSTVGGDIADTFVSDIRDMVGDTKSLLDDLTSYGKTALAGMYAGLVGTKMYIGELSKPGAVTSLITGGDPKLLERTYGAAYNQADAYLTKLGARVKAQALTNARERLADKIGYNTPDKHKADRHAEQLAREAAAMEAQIRGRYALADAYGVSGGAALVAEARAKAETAAITKRADVQQMVSRQIRLTVAERVADAAKGTAALVDQARLQGQVNAEVAAGAIPAERAAELLRDRMADLPLLAAIEAARIAKDVEGGRRAVAALDDQRAARDRLTDAERAAQQLQMLAQGKQQLDLIREETRLIGESEAVRVRLLAIMRATQQAEREGRTGKGAAAWVAQQGDIASAQLQLKLQTDAANDALYYQAQLLDTMADNAVNAARGMADAFGDVGRALGDTAAIFAGYMADQKRLVDVRDEQIRAANDNTNAEQRAAKIANANAQFALRNSALQVGTYGDMADAARGFFKEGSDGWKATTTAMKVFRAVEFALSVRAMAQDAFATGQAVVNGAIRIAKLAAEGIAAQAKLPFPLNIAAMGATAAALAAIGASVAGAVGGGGSKPGPMNDGSGTVLGDTKAQSESIRRSIDQLREVDVTMLNHSREMAASLRSIDSQIGGFASAILRTGDVNANASVDQGFKANAIGSILGNVPLIGGLLKGLFGTSTSVTGSGLYGGAQSLGSVLDGGFDASYYSDVKKTKKFLGITTGTSYSTAYSGADAGLEKQFTLILRSFADAIGAAAGPLGVATSDVETRLRGFVVDIGRIDLQGLSGEQIEEKLSAVFGSAADRLAAAALPGFERFQQAGEGLFETVVRVASTVEAVTAGLGMLGSDLRAMGIDAKLGLAAQFDSVSDLTSAAGAYFETYYSKQEQAAARLAQFGDVFGSLGVTMPASLTSFRALVDAQDLTTAAGQATYATLLKLAPAFADLQESMNGAKSAADVLAERGDLERKLMELRGDTAAIRALDLAKLDESNRALQMQVWAVQDAQEAAKAADQLREAWTSVGDSIRDEVARIRGLSGVDGSGGFATLQGRFNAANTLARGGDMGAAKELTGLSQALLTQAEKVATSRQELDRIRAQTAAALESTYGAIQSLSGTASPSASIDTLIAAVTTAQAASTPKPANDDQAAAIRALQAEIAGMRAENNAGHSSTAREARRGANVLENVSGPTGGDRLQVAAA